MTSEAVLVRNLDFSFGADPILKNVSLQLPYGARCVLVGANGAGKSTLLKILAGKRLVKDADVNVLGKSAFHDAPPGITYLGTEWAGNPIVRRDVPVTRLVKTMGAEQWPERCAQLLEIMDVDPNWHMHEVSDGERRRVQIVLGLLRPWDLLLLDEVTVDLDVMVRANLLRFLREETQRRPATIMYATHIFDGLGSFPTHVIHLRDGSVQRICDVSVPGSFPDLEQERQRFSSQHQQQQNLTRNDSIGGAMQAMVIDSTPSTNQDFSDIDNSPLLRVVERWLREDHVVRKQREKEAAAAAGKKLLTHWEVLSENMKEYGDKYYNYWN